MFRVAAFGFLLGALAPIPVLAAQEGAPEILGVTYPRSAPPDLVASPVAEGWVMPNATGLGAVAAATPALSPPAGPIPRITADLGLQTLAIAALGPVGRMSRGPAPARSLACSQKNDRALQVTLHLGPFRAAGLRDVRLSTNPACISFPASVAAAQDPAAPLHGLADAGISTPDKSSARPSQPPRRQAVEPGRVRRYPASASIDAIAPVLF